MENRKAIKERGRESAPDSSIPICGAAGRDLNPEKRVQVELQDRLTLELFGVLDCPAHWQGHEHVHPFWELLYTSNDGLKQAGSRSASKCYLIPPMDKHAFFNDSDASCVCLYVGFHFDFLSDQGFLQQYDRIASNLSPAPVQEQLRLLLDRVNGADTAVLYNERLSIIRILSEILDINDVAGSTTWRKGVVSKKVIRFLRDNLDKTVSKTQLAEMFYLSPNYLGDIFKKETGESIKQYHKRLRMQKAIVLLSEREHSITEISEILGYENQSYFSRVFKEYYGRYPSEWRR